MRIVIATGGTGGHIYPALSLADTIKKKKKNTEILFIGSNNRMESKEIPQAGYQFRGIDVIGMNGTIYSKIKALTLIKKAENECKKILKDFHPDIVIGFGNYISVPVIMAACQLKIPTMIHEQNSYAGKANKMLSKKVDAIVGSYKENLKQFPLKKTRILGNPRASEASVIEKDEKFIKSFDLSPDLPLAIFVMGSLGSTSVNQILKLVCEKMNGKNYQAIVVTGKQGYDEFITSFQNSENVKVVPYIDGLNAMKNATVVVARGGATTSAEITAMGIPAILIPSPYVPNNHQVCNALALQNENAAIMIEEKDLTADFLIEKLEKVLYDCNLQKEMMTNAKKLAKPNASQDILQWIEQLIGDVNE